MIATADDWKHVHRFLTMYSIDPGFTPGSVPTSLDIVSWGLQDPYVYEAAWAVLDDARRNRIRLEEEAERERLHLESRRLLAEFGVGRCHARVVNS